MDRATADRDGQPAAGRPAARDWGTAAIRAAIVFLLSYLGFIIVPNKLVQDYLVDLAPRARDGLVLVWVVVFFGFLSWLFVRLQRPIGKGRRALRG